MLSLEADFVIVPIDKATKSVVFICKRFNALTFIKEIILIVIYQTRIIITPINL